MKKTCELTMVIPDLTKRQAQELRVSLIDVKKTYAPNGKGSIQLGKRENFPEIMKRCNRQLNAKKGDKKNE